MITFAVIHLGPEEVSPSLIERLRSIYADRIFKQGFFLKLPVDDPRAQEAIKLLDESGLHPWRSETGAPVKGVKYTLETERFDALAPTLRESLDSFRELPGPVPGGAGKSA